MQRKVTKEVWGKEFTPKLLLTNSRPGPRGY